MRAIYPDTTSMATNGTVQIYYEVYENDDPTIFLIPPSPITHSRIYKGQIPYLARHFRVVTFDGRGNGKSDRPAGANQHTTAHNVTDAIAVLDASGTGHAILVAHCHANMWAFEIARNHPDRVSGWVAIEPGLPYIGTSHDHWKTGSTTWNEVLDDPSGWELFNRHVMTSRHRDWVEFFFRSQLVEPHSTKQLEDAVEWALESTGEILADSEEAQEVDLPDREDYLDLLEGLNIPVLVIHGTSDVCQHIDTGRALARLTDGEFVQVSEGGHLTLARDPVTVNRAIKDFVARNSMRVS